MPITYPAYAPAASMSFTSSNMEISVTGTPGPTPQTGTIQINSNLANATFILSPPVAGALTGAPYPVTINNAPAGLYSITFNGVQGYTTPSVPPQTLAAGGVISFNGQYAVAAPAVILFDATQLTQSPSLNPQATFAYADSQGISHGYNAFAIQGSGALDGNGNPLNFNSIALQLSIQSEGSGSVMTLTVPSGGDSSCHCLAGGPDQIAGGTVQFLIPFGLTVNGISGINANFGSASSPVGQAFACGARVVLDAVVGYAFGSLYTGFQLLDCALPALVPPPAPCSVAYPMLNDQSDACIADPTNNSLFGDKALNTHQIRTIRWKPSADGLTLSGIQFHLDQTPPQIVSIIQQKGITVYVHTLRGDFWLDNFR